MNLFTCWYTQSDLQFVIIVRKWIFKDVKMSAEVRDKHFESVTHFFLHLDDPFLLSSYIYLLHIEKMERNKYTFLR